MEINKEDLELLNSKVRLYSLLRNKNVNASKALE